MPSMPSRDLFRSFATNTLMLADRIHILKRLPAFSFPSLPQSSARLASCPRCLFISNFARNTPNKTFPRSKQPGRLKKTTPPPHTHYTDCHQPEESAEKNTVRVPRIALILEGYCVLTVRKLRIWIYTRFI